MVQKERRLILEVNDHDEHRVHCEVGERQAKPPIQVAIRRLGVDSHPPEVDDPNAKTDLRPRVHRRKCDLCEVVGAHVRTEQANES